MGNSVFMKVMQHYCYGVTHIFQSFRGNFSLPFIGIFRIRFSLQFCAAMLFQSTLYSLAQGFSNCDMHTTSNTPATVVCRLSKKKSKDKKIKFLQ
jgi:hypothetical protein